MLQSNRYVQKSDAILAKTQGIVDSTDVIISYFTVAHFLLCTGKTSKAFQFADDALDDSDEFVTTSNGAAFPLALISDVF